MDLSAFESVVVRPLRRVEYDRLVELGVFGDERVELLRGILVAMTPQGSAHSNTARKIRDLLLGLLRDRALVFEHSPFGASEDSEPEPDIAVVPPGDYDKDHPASAFLLIEVSDSSLKKDRSIKTDLYAEAGVPEYWIVSLPERLIEVRSQPSGGRYCQLQTFRTGASIRLGGFPDVSIKVDDVLPRV